MGHTRSTFKKQIKEGYFDILHFISGGGGDNANNMLKWNLGTNKFDVHVSICRILGQPK